MFDEALSELGAGPHVQRRTPAVDPDHQRTQAPQPDRRGMSTEPRNLATLSVDRALVDLLDNARQTTSFQVINGLRPELLEPALNGQRVGTIIRKG
jgi:isopentenyl phosphate kinase